MVNQPTISLNGELECVDDINFSAVLCSEKCSKDCNPDRQRPEKQGPSRYPTERVVRIGA